MDFFCPFCALGFEPFPFCLDPEVPAASFLASSFAIILPTWMHWSAGGIFAVLIANAVSLPNSYNSSPT